MEVLPWLVCLIACVHDDVCAAMWGVPLLVHSELREIGVHDRHGAAAHQILTLEAAYDGRGRVLAKVHHRPMC